MINNQQGDVMAKTAIKYLTKQYWRIKLINRKLCFSWGQIFIISGATWPLQTEIYREQKNTSFTSWKTERSVLFSPLQQWPRMGKGQLYTWSLILRRTHYFLTLRLWMPTASKMEEQLSLPNVSIPCHNEQRDKKKRYTVRAKILPMFQFAVLRRIHFTKVGVWL